MPGIEAQQTHTIIVGVDGSDSSTAALRWACEQARRTDSTIDAIGAWGWPMSFGAAIPIPDGYDPAADTLTMLATVIEPLAAEFPSVTIRPFVLEGHAADVLVEASRHADLLVVGNRGHGEFSGLFIGSVSHHCASYAHSPVLIYRAKETNS
jgi:nucleotide-binding universal stress UspA family protein